MHPAELLSRNIDDMLLLPILVIIPQVATTSFQEISQNVTYSVKATRATKILADLSKISSMSLEASPQMRDEVLVIAASNIPLSDLMAKIATVTSGEWKHEGQIYRLVASSTLRRLEERNEMALRIKNVQRAIDERLKRSQPKPKADVKEKQPVLNLPESPEEAIITRLISTVDVSLLATLTPGARIVFSSTPTRTQHPFAGNSTEAINEFIQKHNANLAGNTDAMDQAFSKMTAEQVEAIKSFTKKQNSRIGQVSKALLVATCSGLGIFNLTQLELRMYDEKGSVVYSAQSVLSSGDDEISKMVAAAQGKKPEAPKAKQTPIEYSDDSKALIQTTAGMSTGNFKLKISPELHKKVFNPSQFDPLSFSTSDEILSYAKFKGKPLVADVPDTSTTSMYMLMGKTDTTVESFEKDLDQSKSMVLVSDAKFSLLKPAFPAQARANRLDRDALTTLLRSAEVNDIPSLGDIAEYALHAPDPMQGGIGQTYLMLYVPGALQQSLDGLTNWNMLRFYGSLTPDARSGLFGGNKIPLSNLNATQRACVEQMTYGSNNQLSVDDPQRKSDGQPFWMRMISGSQGQDYRDEPTEIVPNGLPGDGFVEMKSSTESFASPANDGTTPQIASLGILGSDELAIFKMFREDKNYAQISGMLPKFDKLRIGNRTVMSFTFRLTPQISVKQNLKDHHLPKNAPIVSDKNLPDDLQKQVDEKLAMFKKSPLGALGALMGGQKQAIHP